MRARACVAVFVSMLLPAVASAQQAASIVGVARDTSGAVLPGVSVEAASPALIEKVRNVVTDGQGQYQIVDLRPGIYSVTFRLSGFSPVRREGVELVGGFTATINADLRVGELEETVTVTGASPVVDVQSVRQQNVVSDALLKVLPSSTLSLTSVAAITPGYVSQTSVGGVVGPYSVMSVASATFHGKGGAQVMYDGMRVNSMVGTNTTGYVANPATVEEWTVETGGVSAESAASGMVMNMIPKDGANTFSGSINGLFSNDAMQADNLTDALRARGLTTVNKSLYLFDTSGALGGPIEQDRLWFFTGHRVSDSKNQLASIFFNKTQGTPLYTPDPDRPGYRNETYESHTLRLTWQASPRNKVSGSADVQHVCPCRGLGSFNAPEANSKYDLWPQGAFQITWSSPVTGRLLLEAGTGAIISHWPTSQMPEAKPTDIPILEQSTNFLYNDTTDIGSPRKSDRYIQRFAVSYITGSHAFKTGVQLESGIHTYAQDIPGGQEVTYQFLRGVPNQITEWATPYVQKNRMRADLGVYAQDRWTVRRLTLNLGLRYEYFNTFVAAQDVPAARFAPARNFAAVYGVPEWTDLLPRVGASYDLFGAGKTALKVAVGRYVVNQGVGLAIANNPLVTSVNSVNRTWNDANGNFAPDCDLLSPAANGECGAINNQNFGKNNPFATRYANDVLHGFDVRPSFWDLSTEVQQQLGPGLSVTAGFYQNWQGNFTVTRNLAVTPTDYSPFCVTAPVDGRLPGGGGYQLCGLYDVAPTKFGMVSNLVEPASDFGKQSLVNDFFNVTLKGRLRSGIQFGGGVDTGRTVSDQCFVVNSPQDLLNCRVVTPFAAQTQVKFFATYPLPGHFAVSGTIQSTSGPQDLASYPATNAQIAPSLGRNLAAGTQGTALVPLIRPGTQFEGRINQLDLRVSKRLQLSRVRLEANVDAYNLLNASSILGVNATYGSKWLLPVQNSYGGAILDARIIQVSARVSF